MDYQLYNYYRSSSSYRVRIAMNLKGLEYAYLPVHLNRNGGEQFTSEFRAISPDAVVPVLVAGEKRLIQSTAIIEWLEETHPVPPLLPDSPDERASVRAMCLTIACEIHPLNNLRVLKYLTGPMGLSEEHKARWAHHWCEQGLAAVEALLQKREASFDFCYGDAPGMADVYLVPQVFNAQRFGVDVSKFPLISRVVERCNQLQAFIDSHPNKQPDAE
ncbi:maleylacetoacetate isomerase [Noviherbaspirillum malthae]|jgi:maleylpyruvate isomerase|uniref:maleylacetoacetate isomerase n=1 Tax=Noviherbaspirillum malthae TaxID=1260987 RepID=UPI00188E5286|nr:maleylacetoacetate isomerase [Noviherbaspirillum malthae]